MLCFYYCISIFKLIIPNDLVVPFFSCLCRIAMSDEELRELGLISLTEEHYLTLQRELVARLHRINALYVKICSHQPTPKCPTLRRLLMFRTPPPVGPSEEITGDGLFKLFIEDAHGVAAARLQSYLRSSLGGLVRRRLAEDLKISKHRLLLSLVQDPTKSSKYADATSAKIEENMSLYGADKASALKTLDVHFLFGKYCSIYQDEGIDVRDFDLICKEFSMHTKAVHAYLALSQLDPEDAGFIYFVNFLRFMRGVMYESLSHDLLMGIRQSTLRLLQESTRSRYFFHAADALMARFRSVQRMEVTVREGILYSGDFRFELYLHTLQVFYRRCEGGDVADDLNARKYHIMSQSTKRGGDAMLDGEDDYDDDGGESREGQEESLGTLGHNSLLETQVQSSPALSPTAYTDTAAPAPNTGESEGGDGNAARSPHAVASADVGAEPEEEEEEEIVGFQADNEEEEEPKDQESVAPPTADFVKPAIAGSVYDNLTKWYTLRWREEESEHRVIYSVVEQRAERQYWQNLLTPVGWYNLWTERQFLQQLDSMVDAAGYCIAHKWTKIPPAVAKDGRSAPIATMQQALSVVGAASSVSSLASESLLQRSAAASFTSMVEVEGRNPRGGAHYDNASTSTHTHSLAEDGDEEHPFAYLDLPSRAHWPDSISTVQRTDPSVSGDPAQRSVASGSLGGCPEPLNSPDRGSMHDINAEAAGRGAEVGQESDGFLKFTTQRSVLLEEEAAALSTHGRALYSALLEMAVSVFDTDCTGDLDEGEVRALLRCLRCGLSEKAFRHAFADNDDVIRGVSLRKLVTHLSERVQWDHRERWKALTGKRRAGVGITKRPNIDCAAGLLVSLQRQLAHKRALQSVKLSKIGRIVMLRESHAGTSERTLLVRSQLFAMRQVYMFLRTTQGRIKLHHAKHDVAYSWQREVVGVPSHHPVAASGVRYLNYAYYLHQEAGDGGVLATEIPHVVKFLVARLQLVPTRKVEELALMFTGIRAQTDIRSLNQAEFTALLAPLFEQPKLVDPSGSYWSRLLGLQSSRIRKDAKLRMLSCARQQAVKIAMDFPVIEVGETNYRCSVLGLHLFMKRSLLSQSKSKSGSKAASSISTSTAYSTPALGIPEEPTGSDPAVVAELSTGTEPSALATAHPTKASATATVPKEAVALHLLSLGYSAADLSHSCLADLVDVEHLHGHMQLDPVSLAAATEAARTFIAKTGTYLEAARRLRRKLVNNWRLHAEFKHVARALTQYPEVVDKKGGEFLKEILVGVSHCVDK